MLPTPQPTASCQFCKSTSCFCQALKFNRSHWFQPATFMFPDRPDLKIAHQITVIHPSCRNQPLPCISSFSLILQYFALGISQLTNCHSAPHWISSKLLIHSRKGNRLIEKILQLLTEYPTKLKQIVFFKKNIYVVI